MINESCSCIQAEEQKTNKATSSSEKNTHSVLRDAKEGKEKLVREEE